MASSCLARLVDLPEESTSIAHGSTMIFFSMSIAGALSIAISTFVARWLGASDFGIYSVLVSVQGVVILLASFSMGTAIAKHIAEYRFSDEARALSFAKSGLVLVSILSAGVCVVYTALSSVIGDLLYRESAIVDLVPFSALVVFSTSIFVMAVGMVQGCQRFRLLSMMQISSPLLSLVSISVLLPMMGVRGIFVGYFVSQLTVSSAVFAVINRRGFRFISGHLELGRHSIVLSKLYSFALPAVLGSAMVIPIIWVANTELALTAGFREMGYFAVAFVFYQALIVIPNAIAVPMMPRISQLTVESMGEIKMLVAKVMRILSIGLFPLLFGCALFSKLIVETLYGAGYSASVEAMYLMTCTVYFYALGSVIGTMVTGMGRMWLGLGLNALWAAMFLASVFLVVPELGAKGLALSYVVSYGLFMVPVFLASRRFLHVEVTGIRLPAASAIVLFSIGFLLQNEMPGYGLLANIALFVGGVCLFYIIGRDVFDAMYLRSKKVLSRFRCSDISP